MHPFPPEIQGNATFSLATFRKSGVAVYTRLVCRRPEQTLFHDEQQTGQVQGASATTRQVKIALARMRGRSPDRNCRDRRILRPEEHARARQLINAKYWLARLPWLWRNTDTYSRDYAGLKGGSGPIHDTAYHQGFGGSRRKRLRPEALVILRALCGSGSCGFVP